MREMKDSGIEWIGEIPDDWTIVRNKNAFACSKELVGEKSELTQLLSLTTRGIKKKDINNAEGKLPESFDTYQFVKENDIVMCLFDLDCSAVFSGISPFDGMISPAYRVLSCKECMEPRYADYWFRYISNGRKFNHYAKNIRYTLSYEEFSALPLLLPEKSEQRRIADYLDRKCSQIDAIIARQQEVIEKLKAYKLSVITEAVTKGLNPDVPMKDSGVEWIGEIPEHWIVSSLRYGLQNIQTGPFGSQLHAEDYIEDGVFVINPANIVEGFIVPDNRCSITFKKAQELSRHFLNKGDIIFARRGEMGRCAYFSGDAQQYLCGTGCIKMQCNPNLLPEFIAWFLQTSCVKQYLTLNSVGTTMANLNTTIISGIPAVFPPICEQEKIVQYIKSKINKIDCVLKNEVRIVDKLTEYKKSLIYEVVTGKKEV